MMNIDSTNYSFIEGRLKKTGFNLLMTPARFLRRGAKALGGRERGVFIC